MSVFDKDELHALTIILARTVQAGDEHENALRAKKSAELRVEDAARDWIARRAAFGAFGFNPTAPDFWPELRKAMGEEAWDEGFRRAGHEPPKPNPQVAGPSKEAVEQPRAQTQLDADVPRVRDFIMAELAIAGDAGRKAKDILDRFERIFGRSLHEKTIGMTLFRLKKDELVRREGHTWFLARPPGAETRNPGAGTPGSNSAANRKEEA
jgi:hypothetical protein